MCIIVSKEKNKLIPTKEILKNCFDNNPDGAGFMYVYDKKVNIEKGFMNFESLYNRIIELDKQINLKKRSLIIHFRIGTSGKNDKATCHPFPISNNANELRAEKITCNLAMVHNGIISNFVYGDGVLSDTQNYIKDFVYNLYKINKRFLYSKYTKNILDTSCNHTKLAFLTSDDIIHYYGNFEKDENGIKYSNGTYKYSYKNYFTPTKTTAKNNYDYYDDYYDDYCDDYDDEDGLPLYYIWKSDVALLDDTLCYCTFGEKTDYFKSCDDTMCIDNEYNLYKIVDTIGEYYKVKLIDVDVLLYDLEFKEVTFEKLKNINEEIEEE